MWKYTLVGICLLAHAALFAQLRLPRLLTDHVVLQRDQPIPIPGQAGPRERITLEWQGVTYETRAGKDGRWQITLPPAKAGGPFSIKVSTRRQALTIQDILVGDVWICSGQSNMEWILADTEGADTVMARVQDSGIRHFKIPKSAANTPQDTLAGGEWVVATSQTVANFTAVGYYFARELRQHAGVPIGLINTSWGGSRIEPWMDAQTLALSDDIAKVLQQQDVTRRAELEQWLIRKFGAAPTEDKGGRENWQSSATDATSWPTMALPDLWESQGLDRLDGVVWFRHTVQLSSQQAGQAAYLGLGMIDDSDQTWVNGQFVGETTMRYNAIRRYAIPAGVLKPGLNTIVVRVDDTGGGGGIYGNADSLYLQVGGERISLQGSWQYRLGKAYLNTAQQTANQQPTKLYNFMIHPLIWFPIKGVTWYQGESNANSDTEAKAYVDLFTRLIISWRQHWGQPELPFFWVQLANFRAAKDQPGASSWATLRESQSKTLALPQTGQAVIIDIGNADDIHPRNKRDVGYRLALPARRLVYGETNLVTSGPALKELRPEGNRIRLRFASVGSGLEARRDRYGYLRGFTIAGADQQFHWAQAYIEGDEIVVWSAAVPEPVAVRYAWADNPADANLYNREGLPASPFRTDNW